MRNKWQLVMGVSLLTASLALSAYSWPVSGLCKVLVRTQEILAPVEVPKEDITPEWMTILVNIDNPLKAEIGFTQATVGGYVVDQRIEKDLNAMLAAAKADGVTIYPCSAYRSIDKQTALFNRKIKQYQNNGYNYNDAYNIAKTIVAVPGTSEHHTGLALDLITPGYQQLDDGFENTAAFKWLDKHSAEYGFVLRYPKDKEDITKIIYEPWHYRYVGVNAAETIKANGWCLEEYVENLKQVQAEKQSNQSTFAAALQKAADSGANK